MSLSLVYLSTELGFVNLCSVNKFEVWSDLLLVVVRHNIMNQIYHFSDTGVHLPTAKIFKTCRTNVSSTHHPYNLVQVRDAYSL